MKPTLPGLLRGSFIAGAAYFAAVSLGHALSWKVPGIYVYFSVPSLRYQDAIISFLSIGWSFLFYAASQESAPRRPATGAALASGFAALVGLALINSGPDMLRVPPGRGTEPFWVATALGLVYWILLASLTFLTRSRSRSVTPE